MLSQQKIFKFGVSEMPSAAFSAGHFQQIKTRENAVISFLFYPCISSVIGKVRTDYGIKDVTSKGRDVYPLVVQVGNRLMTIL